MRHKFYAVAVVIAIMLIAAGSVSFSQLVRNDSYLEQFRGVSHERVVAMVWLDVKKLNEVTHPKPDFVLPGDTLLVPMGMKYVAQTTGTRHMWRAAEVFNASVVQPYLAGDTALVQSSLIPASVATNFATTSEGNLSPLAWVIIIVAIVLALWAWWVWLTYQGRQRRKFVRRPPDFHSAIDPMVDAYAREAIGTAFGRQVQVVGPIQRGYVSGELTMLNRDGTTSRERFNNEEAWQARVRFADGHERVVVCRYSCFNPLWSVQDAQFSGTFRPVGSTTSEEVPRISPEQVVAVTRTTRGSDQPLSSADLPGAVEPASPATPTTEGPLVAVAGEDGRVRLTKMQVFDKGGFTIEGDLPLTVEQLTNLAYQLTGRHPMDLDAKRVKLAESPKPEAVQTDKPVTAPEPSAPIPDASSPTA